MTLDELRHYGTGTNASNEFIFIGQDKKVFDGEFCAVAE